MRDEQLGEALQIIRPATLGQKVNFQGRYFSAHLEARPKSAGKMHLLVGGGGRRIIREAAKYADEWNLTQLPSGEDWKQVRAILGSAERRIEISQMGSFVIAENESLLAAKARAMMRGVGVRTTPELYIKEMRKKGRIVEPVRRFGDTLKQRMDSGIEKFYFQVLDPSDTESVDLLAGVLKAL